MSGGIISYVGLTDWWCEELTHDDREEIKEGYVPFGAGDSSIDEGVVIYRVGNDDKPVTKLRVLLDLLNSNCSYEVKKKIIDKGYSISRECHNPLDIHFFFGTAIAIEYRLRDEKEGALERSILACKSQIAVASKAKSKFKKNSYMQGILPSHQGFKQLAIILEKQNKFKEAINLCEKALKQGWSDDWQKRIERCSRKLDKTS
ncbi:MULTISPECIES: tetratricopeptide repeat protein [Yersinia]|uniref:tetratricopeptide repeat protein n=1 Tax=Yersinia TaxID=629 RepID=UPI0011A28E42|nr:tetratricopeptide repeat protein [Yersinia hibernica]